MNIFEQLEKDMSVHLGGIKSEAKAYTEQELKAINEYDQGMKDCENGVPHKSRSTEYDLGYSDQYAFEQTQNSKVII